MDQTEIPTKSTRNRVTGGGNLMGRSVLKNTVRVSLEPSIRRYLLLPPLQRLLNISLGLVIACNSYTGCVTI